MPASLMFLGLEMLSYIRSKRAAIIGILILGGVAGACSGIKCGENLIQGGASSRPWERPDLRVRPYLFTRNS
jgi:hypothetical protein